MDSEYSHLESLVQDVSSIETARMTLRWALERLNALERTNRELEEKFLASSEAQKSAERRLRDTEETVSARMKLFTDQEAYYKKLEQTVGLLSEGKIDLAQIARKEVDLERVRREMEDRSRKQLEDLERAHREMAERWTERLTQTEAYAPEKLAEAVRKYDEFRRVLDREYQDRLARLEEGFHRKEGALLKREQELDGAYQAKLQELDAVRAGIEPRVKERVRELEAAYESVQEQEREGLEKFKEDLRQAHLVRQQELETERERFREELLREREAQVEYGKKEEQRRVGEQRQSWEWERQWFLEENKGLETRLQAAMSRIAELSEILTSMDRKGHDQIIEWVSTTERAFQLKMRDFERLQSELQTNLEEKTRRLEDEYVRRRAELERDHEDFILVREKEREQYRRAMEDASKAERERLEQQLAKRDAGLAEMGRHLEQVQHRLIQAESVGQAQALESLRAELEAEFSKEVEAFEADAAAKRREWERQLAERDSMLEELRRTLQATQSRLVAAESTGQAQALEALRAKLTEEFQGVIRAKETEAVAQRLELERLSSEREQGSRQEVSQRNIELAQMARQLQETQQRLVAAESTGQAQAVETLRVKMTGEFQEVLRTREAAAHAKQQALEQEVAKRDEALERERKAAETVLAVTAHRLDAQFSERQKALESQYEKKLAQREAMIEEMGRTLRETQDRLVRAESSGQAQALEALRAKLTEEFQGLLRAKETETAAQRQELGRLSVERIQSLRQEMSQRDAELAQMRRQLQETQQRLVQSESTGQAQAVEALRSKLTEQFQGVLRTREEEAAAERVALERRWSEETSALKDQMARASKEALEDRNRLQAEAEQKQRVLEQELAERIRAADAGLGSIRSESEAAMGRLREQFAQRQKESEAEFEKKIAEREATLQELRGSLQTMRDRLIESESTGHAKALESLRVKLTEEFQAVIRNREVEASAQYQVLEKQAAERARVLEEDRKRIEAEAEAKRSVMEQDAQGRIRALESNFEKKLSERETMLMDLRQQLQEVQDRLVQAKSTGQAQALESLRNKLTEEFQTVIRKREAEALARYQSLERQSVERVRLLEEERKRAEADASAKQQALEQEISARTQAFEEERGKLEARFTEREKALESQLAAKLSERDAMLVDLRRQLQELQDRLVRSESTGQAQALESLRSKLTGEFQAIIKIKEEEASARIRALEEGWRSEVSRLQDRLLQEERDAQQAASAMESWKTERVRLLEDLMHRDKQVEAANAEANRWYEELDRQRETLRREIAEKNERLDAWETRTRQEYESRRRQLEDHARLQTAALEESLKAEREKLAQQQRRREAEMAEREAAWKREREELAAGYESQKGTLIAACDRYRRELEAREESLKRQERGQ